jgi:hypothetical protein
MAVPTPVMAKARIGHFAEAQVLRAPLAATWANVGTCVRNTAHQSRRQNRPASTHTPPHQGPRPTRISGVPFSATRRHLST